jgi:MICOS complex subunit MIC60
LLFKIDSNIKLENLNLKDTFVVLDYAQHYIEEGNIENGLRLMQQLKGEPLRIANDWINDTILLLELKQATNLLISYISSIYIGTHIKN